MPRSLASLCASVCSLILIACSSGNIDTAEPSEEPDTPVEIETSTEDSSVSASESAENEPGLAIVAVHPVENEPLKNWVFYSSFRETP